MNSPALALDSHTSVDEVSVRYQSRGFSSIVGKMKSGALRKSGVDFEAHAAGISHQRGSWLACRREVLLNFDTILPKTHKTERYMLYLTVRN
jgi:hypothetical protein